MSSSTPLTLHLLSHTASKALPFIRKTAFKELSKVTGLFVLCVGYTLYLYKHAHDNRKVALNLFKENLYSNLDDKAFSPSILMSMKVQDWEYYLCTFNKGIQAYHSQWAFVEASLSCLQEPDYQQLKHNEKKAFNQLISKYIQNPDDEVVVESLKKIFLKLKLLQSGQISYNSICLSISSFEKLKLRLLDLYFKEKSAPVEAHIDFYESLQKFVQINGPQTPCFYAAFNRLRARIPSHDYPLKPSTCKQVRNRRSLTPIAKDLCWDRYYDNPSPIPFEPEQPLENVDENMYSIWARLCGDEERSCLSVEPPLLEESKVEELIEEQDLLEESYDEKMRALKAIYNNFYKQYFVYSNQGGCLATQTEPSSAAYTLLQEMPIERVSRHSNTSSTLYKLFPSSEDQSILLNFLQRVVTEASNPNCSNHLRNILSDFICCLQGACPLEVVKGNYTLPLRVICPDVENVAEEALALFKPIFIRESYSDYIMSDKQLQLQRGDFEREVPHLFTSTHIDNFLSYGYS